MCHAISAAYSLEFKNSKSVISIIIQREPYNNVRNEVGLRSNQTIRKRYVLRHAEHAQAVPATKGVQHDSTIAPPAHTNVELRLNCDGADALGMPEQLVRGAQHCCRIIRATVDFAKQISEPN